LLFREALARGLDRNDRSVRNWLVEQMRVLSDDTMDDAERLYVRARKLGLDRTDVVVRRILVQKMRLLAARTGERRPTDTERAETRTWIGPVPSPYGLHLVWVEARVPGTPPPFEAVRERVLERWQDEQRGLRVVALLRDLGRRYPLRVESAAWRQRSAS